MSFWTIFCPFMPLTTPKTKIFKNSKTMPGDIIVLKMCAINAIHDVSFLKYGAQQRSFSVILDHFLPLPPNNLKNQNSVKKKKKSREISSFYTSVPKIMIICYTVPEIQHMMDVDFIFHFWLFFCFFTPITAQKIKSLYKWKKCLEISFYTCVTKIKITWCRVPEIRCVTEGQQMNRQKKWHLEMGAPPQNSNFHCTS